MTEPLAMDDIESQINQWRESAATFQDTVLSPQRTRAIEYYQGVMDDLPAPEGRSSIVTTELRDTVRAQLPSLMRVFLGPERIVEFEPRRADQEPEAKQRTAYLDVVLREDNNAFLEFYRWFKDADLSMGVMKWWWEPVTEISTYEQTGLTREQVAILEADDDVTFTVIGMTNVLLDDGTPLETYDVRVQQVMQQGRAKFAAIPPEDFLYDPEASHLDTCVFAAHRSRPLPSELAAMGYSPEEIEDGASHAGYASDEAQARSPNQSVDPLFGVVTDDRVDYCEAYVLLDRDGTGVASRYKACLIGSTLVRLEPWPEVPFAILVVDPTPHRLDGLSTADLVSDLQKVKTAALRGTLDTFAFAINPRLAYQEGMVDIKALQNTEIGALIGTYAQPGTVLFPVQQDFVGREGMALMAYLDEIRENRTGVTKAAAGLDPDSLQSSTRAAVAATVSGAQQHLELKARLYAETGVKRLIKGLAGLIRRHQDFERMVRLTGQWTPVDPRRWTDDLNVKINVATGLATQDDKLQGLLGIIAKQEQYLQLLGPQNPLVSLGNLREALARAVELGGFAPTADAFFQRVDDEALKQQAAEAAQQPPEPSPEQVIAQAQIQIERMKVEKDVALRAAELQQKEQLAMAEDARKREETEIDAVLRVEEMNLKYKADLELKALDVQMEDARQETALAAKALDVDAKEQSEERSAQREAAKPAPKPKRKRTFKIKKNADGVAEVEVSEAGEE